MQHSLYNNFCYIDQIGGTTSCTSEAQPAQLSLLCWLVPHPCVQIRHLATAPSFQKYSGTFYCVDQCSSDSKNCTGRGRRVGERRGNGERKGEKANPLCVDCVNQPPVQPISPQSTAALNEALRRDLSWSLWRCITRRTGACVHSSLTPALGVWDPCGRGATATQDAPCDSMMQ